MSGSNTLQPLLQCPLCGGAGKVVHSYRYRPQQRSDTHIENIERSTICSLCAGEGQITQAAMAGWIRLQANPLCPACKAEGGRYFWTWDETSAGTGKAYHFEPCSLCHGDKHVSSDQLALHARQQQKLRFWGIGCTLVFVVVGLLGATQVVSLLMARTPWIQCCAPPHVVVVTGLIVLSRKMGWFL